MKTKILLIALAFGLMSGMCSKEDSPAPTQNNVNCNCGLVVDKAYFTNINGLSFTHLTIKNNCTGLVTTKDVDGNVSAIGQQYCN